MYIKIKYLKYSLLVIACVTLLSVNYFTYVKADTSKESCNKTIDSDCDGLTNDEENVYGTDSKKEDTDGDGYSDGVEVKSGYSPTKAAPGDRIVSQTKRDVQNYEPSQSVSINKTEELTNELQEFVASKGSGSVSNDEINSFIKENLAQKASSGLTAETLPEFDSSQLKVLAQKYDQFSKEERKIKLEQDAITYYTKIIYILISNAPKEMLTNRDFEIFKQDFFARVSTLASPNPDLEYFRDLGKRLELALGQINQIEVPETMLDLHVKSVRIAEAFLALNETPSIKNDPLTTMQLASKLQDLTIITSDYFGKDFVEYFNSL